MKFAELTLSRTGSLDVASGFVVDSISSLFFGWLVHVHSARMAILGCAVSMGLWSIRMLLLPLMKFPDEKWSPDATLKESEMKGA
jgi:hypothetical protein